ncbi:MAG TPA: hypothetical protein PKY56_01460 [Candidatus Kapabacteria bacterium]|nr:hypothetical protein [Candidatus Kapabacteria bacterium]HPO62241.1 hypothetical protein [Candidatus Kapabacteria bacterium]
MKPAKIIIKLTTGIVITFFLAYMFLDLEKSVFYYLSMNAMWLMFNIEKYYKNIVEEKLNISISQMKLAKMPYIISMICLVTVLILEFTLNISMKDRVLSAITFLNLLSNIYGYFLFKHLNKVAIA